ncbi:SOS response-associated peptidase [Mucilaginibacter sp.]
MCARYTATQTTEQLLQSFDVKTIDPFRPGYNIAPTREAPVIIAEEPDRIQAFHFGLVPFWAEDTRIGSKLLNARSETLLELKTFKPLMKHHKRCLVIADGFYEWKATTTGKQPYRFTLTNGEPFTFAGLWSQWKNPQTQQYYNSFTIITGKPNQQVASLHDRMPIMLHPEDRKLWLADDVPLSELMQLCKPFPDEEMKMYPVSKDVNKVSNDHAGLILPANSK